jgi:hypothetical protein
VIPARLLNRSLSLIQPAVVVDPYGDSSPDYAAEAATFTGITGRLDQASTRETNDETRDLALSDLILYTNATGIAAADLISDGTTFYDVVGHPARVDTPRGQHHFEVRLRRSDFVISTYVPGTPGSPGSSAVGDRPVWFGAELPTTDDWVVPYLWFNTTTEELVAVLADSGDDLYVDLYVDTY